MVNPHGVTNSAQFSCLRFLKEGMEHEFPAGHRSPRDGNVDSGSNGNLDHCWFRDLILTIKYYLLRDVDLLVIAEQLRHNDSVFDSYLTCSIVHYSSVSRSECRLHFHNI